MNSPMVRSFRELIEARWAEGKFACVGLDPDIAKIPACLRKSPFVTDDQLVQMFLRRIIVATRDLVCAYKPNSAFFEALGLGGTETLRYVMEAIRNFAPEVPVILDAKRGDIGSTNEAYARWAFDFLGADAITIHPYLGQEANKPFLDRRDKGVFVLCRTSNPGGGEFQDLGVTNPWAGSDLSREDADIDSIVAPSVIPLYQRLAHDVTINWNTNGNCGLVVGATYPDELKSVRAFAAELPLLIPGIGAQGGDLEKTIAAGASECGGRMVINSSRAILYASNGEDFAEAARRETEKLHASIQEHLKNLQPSRT